ncbi:MAG: apolipoprotein N-acyltransferase [Alphaproteobacteria bacterium]|nr:apolipoprotein N-acyltransferase [Alphaproteobacteria bacterium]
MVAAHPRLIAFLMGAMAALGFAPMNLWPLMLIGLAVLMHLVRSAPGWRAAAGRGWFWGWGHFMVNSNWIAHAFTYQDAMPHWLGWAAVAGLGAFLAVYVGAVGVGSWWARARALPFTLIFASAWVFAEYARAELFTGYAWDPVGVVFEPTWLREMSPFTGTYGVSGVAIVLSCLILASGRPWHFGGLALAGALLWLGGLYLPTTKSASEMSYPHIVIIQPNIPEEIGNDPNNDSAILAKQMALVPPPNRQHPRLIIWPEGATIRYLDTDVGLRRLLASHLGPHDLLALGGPKLEVDAQGHFTGARNSIYVINAAGDIVARYDKAHLVPGGDYLPLRPLMSAIGLARLVPGDIDDIPGPGPRTFTLPDFGKAGFIICYEAIFSGEVTDRATRPDFIINPSDDAWFGSWGPPQHLAQAQMRALEEGIPIIRATTTGISAVIDAQGHLKYTQPLHTQGVIEADIPPATAPTLFSRYGNAIPLTFAALLLISGIALARRTR